MKNIMLAVTGLNPQVITEALYALYHEGRPVHAIHIITTRTGKDAIFADLLSPLDGRLAAFFTEYEIDPATMDCGPHTLHVLKNKNGVELDDIVDAEDNEILLTQCMDLTFRFTKPPDTAVFFLVAGGRKTMTSCLTLAAQLYGRPQDRIYHVLVTPEFENSRDFWYPPRKPVPITLYNEKKEPCTKSTAYAAIELISIPFVSVRDRLAGEMLDAPRQPADLLGTMIRDDPKMLYIKLVESKVIFNGREMDMYPAHLALYAFFAEIRKNSLPGSDCFIDTNQVYAGRATINRFYSRIAGAKALDEMSRSGIASLNQENFNSYKSKIRQALARTYGQAVLADLEISSVGKRLKTRYGIRLDRERIVIEG